MNRHFDQEIQELKELVLEMGGNVEAAVGTAITSLLTNDKSLIQTVFEHEKIINDLHIKVDSRCFHLLALQAPVATDLRLIIAVMKMNTDLERMGDQAVNIAHNLDGVGAILSKDCLDLIPEMAARVQSMVTGALNAFVQSDTTLAHDILSQDDIVDSMDESLTESIMQLLKEKPQYSYELFELAFISKNLERVADHATNIAEDVIFISNGEDVRHANVSEG